ncbi:MAG: rod shape-determining protein MreC [Bacteroidales bacterium]|nr:rod shape-determining protein MreC [Bacteroidales bacterium]
MRNLLDFVAKYYYWVLFILLEAVSMTLFFRCNSYQGSVWFTSANRVVAEIDRFYAQVAHYLSLQVNNAELTRQNTTLHVENEALRRKLSELTSDTTLAAKIVAEALRGYTLIPAEVTSNDVRHRDNLIIINRGAADGVSPEMGVVSGTGVVGIVSKVSEHYAVVVPIINSKSSISCRVRGSQYFGYLKWQGGNPLLAELTDIPRYANPQEGVLIETSGFSAVFPPGIFVGRAVKIEDSADGLSYAMRVNLSTDFRRLQHVAVIATAYQPEVQKLGVEAALELTGQ